MMNRREALTIAVSAPLALVGCDNVDVAEWTEEVVLHDGRVIQVWRQARARHGGFPNARRGGDLDFRLKYAPLHAEWSGDWRGDPVSFELFDDVPHLVLFARDPSLCANKAKSDYSARFLRLESSQWIQVSQDHFPLDKALANLYGHYWGQSTNEDAHGLITWLEKARNDGFYPEAPETVKRYFEKLSRYCSRV